MRSLLINHRQRRLLLPMKGFSLRFAHAQRAHARSVQGVISDARVVGNNNQTDFAPAGAKLCEAFAA